MSRAAVTSAVIAEAMSRMRKSFVRKRQIFFHALLWWAIVAVILLPSFSQVGYPVWSLEYTLVALASLVIGIACLFGARLPFLRSFLLVVLPLCTFLLYFGAALWNPYVLYLLVLPLLLAFVVLVISHPGPALRILGFAALAQISAVAMATPEPTVRLADIERSRTNVPSVLHILLDGHAGLAAFPANAVKGEDVKRLEDLYLSRGFTIFRRAYSAHMETRESLAQLFNPDAADLPVAKNPARGMFELTRAEILEEISKRRALDLTFIDYVDIWPAVRNIENLARSRRYTGHGGATASVLQEMPTGDRLWIAAAIVHRWFIVTARSPLAQFVFSKTDWGLHWHSVLHPASWTNPLMGRATLKELTARLECCGRRGTYIFAHLIHPHAPLIFTESCAIPPPRHWLYRREHRLGVADTLETRMIRWQRHFDQAYCAGADVAYLADMLEENDELSDATIIVHGDHGPRLGVQDHTKIEGYDKAAHERDWRGTFFAVRLPGMTEGRIIEIPVRIDDIYKQLAGNDFRALDADALGPRGDSPYTE